MMSLLLCGSRKAWLRFDLLAGATAAAVVLPQAIAYSTIAGLPLQYGLYCALVPAAVYAFLGSSRALSVSTTSSLSLLTAAAILTAPSNADPVDVAAVLALEVGGFLLLAGVFRLGFLSDFISRPVLAGFKVGMGLTIAASQLGKVLGVPDTGNTFFPKMKSVLENLDDTSIATLTVALACIALLVLLRRYAPGIPGPLVVLAGSMVLIAATSIASRGVATVPPVPSGLPHPALPELDLALGLLPSAAGIALMAFVESIASARAFRTPAEPQVRPSREMLALGAANAAGSFFGAYPSGGGLSQTSVNDRAGARSRLPGLIVAIVAALVLLVLAPLLKYIPEAALGAIVLIAAWALVSRDEEHAIHRQRAQDWVLGLITFGAVLLFGTLDGILVGVAASLLSLFWALNQPPITSQERDGVLVVRIESPIYFGNAQRTFDHVVEILERTSPAPLALVLDCSAMPDVDTTSAAIIGERMDELEAGGTPVLFAAVSERVLEIARRGPRWERRQELDRIHPTVEAAVHEARSARYGARSSDDEGTGGSR
jgi:SulP family sulfate permease